MDAVFPGNNHAAVEKLRLAQDFAQAHGLSRVIVILDHRRADGHDEIFLLRKRVQFTKERDGLFLLHVPGVFRKRLRGDADGLDFVAPGLVDRPGILEHFQRVGDLRLVAGAFEAEECRNGADFGLFRSGGLLRGRGCGNEQYKRRDAEGPEK